MGNTDSHTAEMTISRYITPPSTPPRVTKVRSDIAATAVEKVGSKDWAKSVRKDDYPGNTYKCNKFVHDVLKEAKASPPVKTASGQGTWPIQAADWATHEQPGHGWSKQRAGSYKLPGDVISREKRSSNATGHCGIVVHGGQAVGASEHAITRGAHGFKSDATLTRYEGFPRDYIDNVGTWDIRKSNITYEVPGNSFKLGNHVDLSVDDGLKFSFHK